MAKSPVTQQPESQTASVAPASRSRVGALIAMVLGVMLAAAIVFWPALQSQAVRGFDVVCLKSRSVQTPNLTNAKRVFRTALPDVFQPLPIVSLMLDTKAGGGNPTYIRPYHRTSLALHVVNTGLLVVLLYCLFANPWAAGLAGLLFGLHPLATEPIATISQRSILLATTFGLISLIAYVGHARRGSWLLYAVTILSLVAALMCQPVAIVLPLIMLLLDWWPLRRLGRVALLEKILPLLLAAYAARWLLVRPASEIGAGLPLSVTPLIAAKNFIFCLAKAFWPAGLTPYYPRPEPLALAGPILVAVLAGAAVLVVAIVTARKLPAILVGILIVLLSVLPGAQVLRFSDAIAADRFAYWPLIGLLIIVAAALSRLLKTSGALRAIAICLVLAAAVGEGYAARRQIAHWRDNHTLASRMIATSPDVPALHTELARLLMLQQRGPEAIEELTRVVAMLPNSAEARNELAEALFAEKRPNEGLEQLREVCKLYPDSAEAHYRLGVKLAAQKDYRAADQELTRALQLKPDLHPAYADLGHVLLQMNRVQDAVDIFVRVADLFPQDAKSQFNLAVALARQGKLSEAIARYRSAIEADPKYVDARKNLALCLLQTGEARQAVDQLQEAIKLEPESAVLRSNLAGVLREAGELEASASEAREALRLDPKNSQAHINYALTLAAQGKVDEAVQDCQATLQANPNLPDVHYVLGNLLKTREPEKAIEHYQAALNIDPNFAPAKAALQALNRPIGQQ